MALTIARASLPLAVFMALCGTLAEGATDGKSLAVLAPAGALIVSRGVLMLSYRDAVLAPLAQREAKGIWGRTGLRIEHGFGAAMLLIIGTGWTVMGVMYGVT